MTKLLPHAFCIVIYPPLSLMFSTCFKYPLIMMTRMFDWYIVGEPKKPENLDLVGTSSHKESSFV